MLLLTDRGSPPHSRRSRMPPPSVAPGRQLMDAIDRSESPGH
jgi:hypothetical protein